MPVSCGKYLSSRVTASNPPAEAPMPTTGKLSEDWRRTLAGADLGSLDRVTAFFMRAILK